MIVGKRLRILNSKGEPIRLTKAEKYHADYMQRQLNERFKNNLGYEVPVTTLTEIIKKVSQQKFFKIAPADYLPVRAGVGQWSTQLTTYRTFDTADAFETGIINNGGNSARQAMVDTAVDAVNVKVFPWAKGIGWSIFELEQAAKSGNWDLVASKERSRKMNWDLGIQRIAFLGAQGLNTGTNAQCLGLLNQVGVLSNTTVITKAITAMTATELSNFAKAVLEAYRVNCQRTAWPTHFIIPESDYNGLTVPSSADFPLKSKLTLLLEAFRETTMNPQFQIKPLAYADAAQSGLGVQRYTLMNYDEESIRMDIPLPYTNTLANSIDNFNFQNTGYGQFTGVQSYRPLEMMYFDY